MSEPPAEQTGRILAAPAPRRRLVNVIAIAAVVLAVIVVVASLIAANQPSPADLVAIVSSPDDTQAFCSAAFSPDGKTLAVADCQKDSVSLWDIATRRWTGTLASPRCPDGAQVTFSPDGKTLALVSGYTPTACLWDMATGRETTLTDPGPGPGQNSPAVNAEVAFSPDGRTLAVSDFNGDIYLWNLATRRVAGTVPAGGHCTQTCLIALSSDGTMLAVGEDDDQRGGQHVYLWDLTAQRWTAVLTDPATTVPEAGDGITGLAFSRDGIVAVGAADGHVYQWNTATRKMTAAIDLPVNMGMAIRDGGSDPTAGDIILAAKAAFSPDGTILAACAANGYGTGLYHAGTGSKAGTLTDPRARDVACIASPVFSRDGTMLAAVNGPVYLWRLPR
jgi:WD40 repeat protein